MIHLVSVKVNRFGIIYRMITTFIIPSIGRDTLKRAIQSAKSTGASVLYEIDSEKQGRSFIRNSLIEKAKTEWVSFLDDDDTVYIEYVARLEEEIKNNPDADVIHFREYFPWGQVFPNWPKVEWGNVGISFSIKREVALEFPFIEEDHEDLQLLKRLESAGKKIVFSKYLTYKARH